MTDAVEKIAPLVADADYWDLLNYFNGGKFQLLASIDPTVEQTAHGFRSYASICIAPATETFDISQLQELLMGIMKDKPPIAFQNFAQKDDYLTIGMLHYYMYGSKSTKTSSEHIEVVNPKLKTLLGAYTAFDRSESKTRDFPVQIEVLLYPNKTLAEQLMECAPPHRFIIPSTYLQSTQRTFWVN